MFRPNFILRFCNLNLIQRIIKLFHLINLFLHKCIFHVTNFPSNGIAPMFDIQTSQTSHSPQSLDSPWRRIRAQNAYWLVKNGVINLVSATWKHPDSRAFLSLAQFWLTWERLQEWSQIFVEYMWHVARI